MTQRLPSGRAASSVPSSGTRLCEGQLPAPHSLRWCRISPDPHSLQEAQTCFQENSNLALQRLKTTSPLLEVAGLSFQSFLPSVSPAWDLCVHRTRLEMGLLTFEDTLPVSRCPEDVVLE